VHVALVVHWGMFAPRTTRLATASHSARSFELPAGQFAALPPPLLDPLLDPLPDDPLLDPLPLPELPLPDPLPLASSGEPVPESSPLGLEASPPAGADPLELLLAPEEDDEPLLELEELLALPLLPPLPLPLPAFDVELVPESGTPPTLAIDWSVVPAAQATMEIAAPTASAPNDILRMPAKVAPAHAAYPYFRGRDVTKTLRT
jgi:hypothetical protein